MNSRIISIIKSFCLIILSTILISCEYSSESDNDPEPGFQYPVEIGNKWTYHHTWENFNFRPDSLSDRRPDMEFTYYIEVIKDTVLRDNNECFIFEQTELYYSDIVHNYYNNKDDGFYQIAHGSGGSMAFPKNRNNLDVGFADKLFKNQQGLVKYIVNIIGELPDYRDSIYYYDKPRPILKYPMVENIEWVLTDEMFSIWKKIVGKEHVTTTAGTFNCYKILWIYGENDWFNPADLEIYEYVCEKGLIKRTISFKNIAITSAESPEPIGYYDSSDEYILTDINF
jgi:hypothetical protein